MVDDGDPHRVTNRVENLRVGDRPNSDTAAEILAERGISLVDAGREEVLDPRDAYEAGWDFPPHMGTWGVISPRTCPNCSIKDTAWWAIAVDHRGIDEMTAQERKAVGRILDELPATSGYTGYELDAPSGFD